MEFLEKKKTNDFGNIWKRFGLECSIYLNEIYSFYPLSCHPWSEKKIGSVCCVHTRFGFDKCFIFFCICFLYLFFVFVFLYLFFCISNVISASPVSQLSDDTSTGDSLESSLPADFTSEIARASSWAPTKYVAQYCCLRSAGVVSLRLENETKAENE